jgi:hypothetical protein
MPGNDTSDQKSIPPTHADFHWILGPGRANVLADFVELAHDISAGISSCLQIIYTS